MLMIAALDARAQPPRYVRAPDHATVAHVGVYLDADYRPLPGSSAHRIGARNVRVTNEPSRALVWERMSAVELRAHSRVWQALPLAPDPDDDLDAIERGRWALWRVAEITERRALIGRAGRAPAGAAWQIVEIAIGRMIEARFRHRAERALSIGRAPTGTVEAWAASHDCEVAIELLGLRARNEERALPFARSIAELAAFVESTDARPILLGLRRVRAGRRAAVAGSPPLPQRVAVRLERVVVPAPPQCATGSMTPSSERDAMGVSRATVVLFEDALQSVPPQAVYWRRGRGARTRYVRDLVRRFPARSGVPAGVPLGIRASGDRPLLIAIVLDRSSPRCGDWSPEEARENVVLHDDDVRRGLDRLDGIVELTTASGVVLRVVVGHADAGAMTIDQRAVVVRRKRSFTPGSARSPHRHRTTGLRLRPTLIAALHPLLLRSGDPHRALAKAVPAERTASIDVHATIPGAAPNRPLANRGERRARLEMDPGVAAKRRPSRCTDPRSLLSRRRTSPRESDAACRRRGCRG